ncbi:sarcosine oxidase subunit gamma [Actinopolyspora mortivallis]|uniref:sarcosine oxidase subunit gamma n=1 Tax=Actinopolyspora mortivallis TaxID=33906 RepID=UPI00037B19C7|nr:sarcosine oxidase subunit gamma family protein [Actinopolyspora mortivallis]
MTVLHRVESESGVADTATVTAERHSPLEHRVAEFERSAVHGPRGVRLAEEPFLTQLDLRMPPSGTALRAVSEELGLPVPAANRVSGDERQGLLWLGPDEWLLVAEEGRAGELLGVVRSAQQGEAGSAVDVSANRTTLRLSGPMAREVLEKVCSVDLHPRAFSTGHCAQTLLGRAVAVLWQVGREPEYRVLVRCSFANYLADLLLDAMAEFLPG